MFNIRKDCILFELCLAKYRKKEQKKERKKKGKKRKKTKKNLFMRVSDNTTLSLTKKSCNQVPTSFYMYSSSSAR